MRILIIGGSRFVGPYIIKELLENGHVLTVVNRGTIEQQYHGDITFIKADRNSGFTFLHEKFDVVIDTCAYKNQHTTQALNDIDFDYFIHFSTAAAYQETQVFPLTERSPIGEWPLWGEYNIGKVACERALAASGKHYAVIRPVYILGPANYCEREQFIYSRLRAGEPLNLPGNGQAVNQFVFAYEVARAIALLAEAQLEGAYNCAGDECITLRGLVETMASICDAEPKITFNPTTDGEAFNEAQFPFANVNFICDNSLIKSLGMTFKPLRENLERDYIEYYKSITTQPLPPTSPPVSQ